MNPENIFCSLLLGNDFDYVLFKTAICFAESGLRVWFISPEAFEKIPENITPPEKEVLELMTFFYLKDYNDLLTHLNGIHLWHKLPTVVILSGFDKYSKLYSENYNPLLPALVSASLLDSISVCAKKKQKECYLILTCSLSEGYKDRLQVLHDNYFPHVINKSSDNESLLNEIVDYFK